MVPRDLMDRLAATFTLVAMIYTPAARRATATGLIPNLMISRNAMAISSMTTGIYAAWPALQWEAVTTAMLRTTTLVTAATTVVRMRRLMVRLGHIPEPAWT